MRSSARPYRAFTRGDVDMAPWLQGGGGQCHVSATKPPTALVAALNTYITACRRHTTHLPQCWMVTPIQPPAMPEAHTHTRTHSVGSQLLLPPTHTHHARSAPQQQLPVCLTTHPAAGQSRGRGCTRTGRTQPAQSSARQQPRSVCCQWCVGAGAVRASSGSSGGNHVGRGVVGGEWPSPATAACQPHPSPLTA
jgi:hypothetical protein